MSDYTPFAQDVAVVTGAARGIGKAIALLLAERGATIVAVDVDEAQAAVTAESAGRGSIGIGLDVSDRVAVDAAVAKVIEDFGKIDILVNCAGITRDAMLHKMVDNQWDSVLAVDLSGVFYLCRAVGTHMRQNKRGRIVNIASASWMGNIGQTNYAAAKAGVVGLTRSISKELAMHGVTANAICPGFIDTEMTRAIPQHLYDAQVEKTPMRRAGQPIDVARVVAFLASDDAGFVTGDVIDVGGGYQL